MSTKQPIWKHVHSLGDVDPIAFGGGFVYRDGTGVYDPEVTWFEPAPDDEAQGFENPDDIPVDVYRFVIESRPAREWWYDKLGEVAPSLGETARSLQGLAHGPLFNRACLYRELIHYFGTENFDSYPVRMTSGEAYKRFAAEMALSLAGGDPEKAQAVQVA